MNTDLMVAEFKEVEALHLVILKLESYDHYQKRTMQHNELYAVLYIAEDIMFCWHILKQTRNVSKGHGCPR